MANFAYCNQAIHKRVLFVLVGVCILVFSIFLGDPPDRDPGPIDWEYYTPEVLQEKLEEGNTVVLRIYC